LGRKSGRSDEKETGIQVGKYRDFWKQDVPTVVSVMQLFGMAGYWPETLTSKVLQCDKLRFISCETLVSSLLTGARKGRNAVGSCGRAPTSAVGSAARMHPDIVTEVRVDLMKRSLRSRITERAMDEPHMSLVGALIQVC
jgi:hypothetical protein